MWLKNDRYVPLCKSCVQSIFDELSRKYSSNKSALIIMCHYMDIPFYHSLFDSINNNNSVFSVGLYCRQLNNRQYQYKTFMNTLVDGELLKDDKTLLEEKEIKWTKEEIANKENAIKIIGYDPFEGYSEIDRRFLFNELVKYFDENIEDDSWKLSQIIQIVNNNNQIRNYDLVITSMSGGTDSIKNAESIKALQAIKGNLVSNNDKIAKENEISVKHRSNKEVGKSSLGRLQKRLRELNFESAKESYYNQLRSEGSQWAIDMSHKSIIQNAMLFDENEKQEIFNMQRERLIVLQRQLDELKEKNRLLQIEIDSLKNKEVSQ